MSERVLPYEVTESNIPLDGITETSQDLVELYGGQWVGSAEGVMTFSLPARRGIAAGDQVHCEMTTEETLQEGGVVRLRSELHVEKSPARLALLLIGVVGAMLWLVWPFFPNLGPVAVIGGVIAFAAYFLSLRRSPAGLMYDFVQRLARIQRAESDEDAGASS